MNILCITDKKGRIQYNRMVMFKSMMKDHNIDVVTIGDRNSIDFSKYDVVYYSHFAIANRVPCGCKIRKLASVTSHKCLTDIRKTVKQLNAFDSVSVNNTILFKALSPHVRNLQYTPNGVDTDFFVYKEKDRNDKITVGWVGNRDRAAKRYKAILRPLIKRCNFCNFRIVAPSKSDPTSELLTREQMRDFYYDIDFFVVTSDAEGTPNPALEAMACGVPVVSSRVGNMVEIIRDGENGRFVNGSLGSYVVALSELSDIDKDAYVGMRRKTSEYIEEWGWSYKIKLWEDFLTSGWTE